MWPCNSMSMRVQAPPLRCRGDSLSPNSATGSLRVAAGRNGEIGEPHLDRSLRKNLWAAQAKTCLSHRDCHPAEEADTLEPKGTGYDAGSPRSALTRRHCHETRWIASPSGFNQWRWGTEYPPAALCEASGLTE